MRIKALCIVLSFLVLSCKKENIVNKKEVLKEHSKIDIIGHTFFKVTETDSGKVLYKPCGANIEKYVIYNDSIFHNLGQEYFMLNVTSIQRIEKYVAYKTIYKYNKEIPDTNDSIIKIVPIDKIKKFWKINNEVFIDSVYANTLSIKKELPCDEDCYDCEENKEQASGLEKNDIINGTWKGSCEGGKASMDVENGNAFLEVMFNQIYIDMIEISRNDIEKGIAYKLKEKPEDLGSYAIKMDWENFINDKPVAYIKIIDDKTLYFYWYGFYNSKTKKREYTKCKFQLDSNEDYEDHHIVLKKCK